jgi:two-component system sensor histidine kinase AtoS
MSQASLRRPLAIFAGAVVAAFCLLRVSITSWACNLAAADTRTELLTPWALDTIGTALLLVAAVAGCCWLTGRARRQEREQTRVEHLAEVGLLAGGLAHEIRNTLNAMHSQIGLLRKQLAAGAGPACQRTGQLERAVAELEQLVSDFLTFARPAKDQLEEVDLEALIRGVLDFAALDLEQGRVKVVTELDPALPPVYADAGKLRRALLNLIINARQAMPDGGTLTVRAEPCGRGEVVIEVRDTGCGIPEEDHPRIFQTFFSTKPEGTGLGLAIVKRTVEDCGGRVTFDSEVGRGTTFRIYLPTAERRRARLAHRARLEAGVAA